jgi:hypothetical protein
MACELAPAMQAEIIALRHQLTVLQRTQKPKRLVLTQANRCLWVWLSRLWAASGQKVPFAQTRADRGASGDPRPSIEERYRNHGAYVSAVARAANGLHRERLLLDEDVQSYIEAASESSVGK